MMPGHRLLKKYMASSIPLFHPHNAMLDILIKDM